MLNGFWHSNARSQTDNGSDGWLDQKGLAGPTIRLFMERDLDLARDHGAPGEDEVSVRSGKDSRKLASIAEGNVGQKVRLRSIGCIFAP
jgi:hypothetical protein